MSRTLLEDSRRLGLEWRDPGPPPPRRSKWLPLLVLMRERPGVWAVMRSYVSYKSAHQTARRLQRTHPDFEFAARPSGGGGELFGRLREGR